MLLNALCVCPRVSRYQSNCLFLHHTVRATSCQGQNRTNTHLTMRLSAYLYWRFGSSSSHQTLTQAWHPLWPVTPSLHAAGAFHTLLAPRQLTTLWKSVRLCVRVCVCVWPCSCTDTSRANQHDENMESFQNRNKENEMPPRRNTKSRRFLSSFTLFPPLIGCYPSFLPCPGCFIKVSRIILCCDAPSNCISFAGHCLKLSLRVCTCVCVRVHSFRSYLA